MLHPKWFKTLDSKTRVRSISQVFYLFLDIFPNIPYVPAIVDFCLFYRYALSFFLSLHRRFPFAICPFNYPSIHPSNMVMLARTRPWIGSRMLNKIDTVLTSRSLLHCLFLFIHLGSFLLLFLLWDHPRNPKHMCSLCSSINLYLL